MYRKVVFSKEPTALKLESLDDAVFLQLKHKHQTFALGGNRDQFAVYPGDLELHRPYFTVAPFLCPDGTQWYKLTTNRLVADELCTPTIQLTPTTHLRGDAQRLLFSVQSSNGHFQFGANDDTPWVSLNANGLTVHGDLHCRRLYQSDPPESIHTPTPTTQGDPRPTGVFLDATGKIPRDYLPEAYTDSVLHPFAGVGVGIGTEVPVQKLHVEGSAYLRDRCGIGISTPLAPLHLRQDTGVMPALRIDADRGIELWAPGAGDGGAPAVSLSPIEVSISPPVSLTTLTILNKFYTESHRLRITTPVVLQAPLVVQSTVATENAVPLRLDAPSVQCASLVSPEWILPLGTTATATGFQEDSWRDAYQRGEETALQLMPDAQHLHLTRLVAHLWDTVQTLTARVKALEEKQTA